MRKHNAIAIDLREKERFDKLIKKVETDITSNPHLNDNQVSERCNTTKEFVRRQRKHLSLTRRK